VDVLVSWPHSTVTVELDSTAADIAEALGSVSVVTDAGTGAGQSEGLPDVCTSDWLCREL
jgi:hypothetical protein